VLEFTTFPSLIYTVTNGIKNLFTYLVYSVQSSTKIHNHSFRNCITSESLNSVIVCNVFVTVRT
jgi:hypothetical protein